MRCDWLSRAHRLSTFVASSASPMPARQPSPERRSRPATTPVCANWPYV